MAADVLVLDIMNQQMLDRFNATHKIDLIARVRAHGKVIAVGEGLRRRRPTSSRARSGTTARAALWGHSGFANQLGLLKYALTQARSHGADRPEAAAEPRLRLLLSRRQDRAGVRDVGRVRRLAAGARQAPRRARRGLRSDSTSRPSTAARPSCSMRIDRRDRAAGRRGRSRSSAIPARSRTSGCCSIRDGRPRADAALSFLFNFADTEAWKLLAKLDIPVHQPRQPVRPQREGMARVDTGLTLFEGTFQVAVPELAGTTAPTVVGSKEKVKDPDTGLTVVVNQPIALARGDGRPARAFAYARARGRRRTATSTSRSSTTTTRPARRTSAPAT